MRTHRASLLALIDSYLASGITRIELGSCEDREVMARIAALQARPARYLVHNYFPPPAEDFVLNLAAVNSEVRERSLTFCRQAIALTARLGGAFYSVHAGFRADLVPASLGRRLEFGAIAGYEPAYEQFVSAIADLAEDCAACGIRLLIEPNVVAPFNLRDGRNDLLMFTEVPEFRRLMRDLASTVVGILLDVGHLQVTAQTLGFAKEAFPDELGEHVGAIHVHDNDGASDQHRPLASDHWILGRLTGQFARCPLVVEAHFKTSDALAAHVTWLAGATGRAQ